MHTKHTYLINLRIVTFNYDYNAIKINNLF